MISLNRTVVDTLTGIYHFSRAIWLDVQPCNVITSVAEDGTETDTIVLADDGAQFAIVARGRDKTLNDASESTAQDKEDRKGHKPALFWNDEKCAERAYILATCEDKDTAETAAAQITDFYSEGASEEPVAFSDRLDALGSDAKALLPAILAAYGAQVNSEHKRTNHIGTYADYKVGKVRKPRAGSKKAAIRAEIEKEATDNLRAQLLAQARASGSAETEAILAAFFATK